MEVHRIAQPYFQIVGATESLISLWMYVIATQRPMKFIRSISELQLTGWSNEWPQNVICGLPLRGGDGL